MNKKSILWILLDLIFLIVFNTVFFLIAGTNHVASVWISYVFIHISYLMVLITPFLIRKSSQAHLFGLSLYTVSSVYFFVEFIVGIVFILLKQEKLNAALIVQIIIAAIYAVILIGILIANESTAETVEKHKEEVSYIKNAAASVKALIGKCNDKKADKAIERIYDLLHSSPTKSNMAVQKIEKNIISKIDELVVAGTAQDRDAVISIVNELEQLIEQRNATLKVNQ